MQTEMAGARTKILRPAGIGAYESIPSYRSSMRAEVLQTRLKDFSFKLSMKGRGAISAEDRLRIQSQISTTELELEVCNLGGKVRLGTCILLISRCAEIVCVQTIHGKKTWGFPKGEVNPEKKDMTLLAAAYREAREEVGFLPQFHHPRGETLPILGTYLNPLPLGRIERRKLDYTHKWLHPVVLSVNGIKWIKLDDEENCDCCTVDSADKLLTLMEPRFAGRSASTIAMIESVNLAYEKGLLTWNIPKEAVETIH